MTVNNILVVDDEKQIVDIVKAYLDKEGFRVVVAYDGRSALELVQRKPPDLIVLDLMLPGVSGWDICRILRRKSNIPIIMLTARDDVTDRIVGLELGADDYVTKPFDPKELVSRVKAVLRRSEGKMITKPIIHIGNLIINTEMRLVQCGDKTIELTPIEYELLMVLAENPGRVYSRLQLLDNIQGDSYEGYERTIDSHIKNLRKKIEPDPNHPSYIMTVYGVGYRMEGSWNSKDA